MHKICKKYNNEREKDKETKHNKKYKKLTNIYIYIYI